MGLILGGIEYLHPRRIEYLHPREIEYLHPRGIEYLPKAYYMILTYWQL